RSSFIGLWASLVQTIQMAIVGTVIGTLPAFLLSFLAARTTSLWRPLSSLVKTLLNIGRAVPILIYGLIVVSAIGLGPSAGTIAIAVGSFVMLAKLYAESLESVALGPVEAVKAAGGNATQVFVFGMLPQVFPNYLSSTLYSLELNLQASFILALVGAGGIGFELQNDIQLDKLVPAGVIIAMLVVLVNLVDYLSYRIRQVFS
ncbi:MAG TPA: ABC transporter permease subunit, partial [Capsulimonadaceae bacterium]|nr:ABC transporter permease subunit [Capsulimonadaceae bacterium]